jgi:serine protease
MSDLQVRSIDLGLATPPLNSTNSTIGPAPLLSQDSNPGFRSFQPPADNSIDNTIAQAQDLGVLTAPVIRTGSVDRDDLVDFYRFSLSQDSSLLITLTGLTSDVDMLLGQDLDGDREMDRIDWSRAATLGGRSEDRLSFQSLAAGTYYLRVYPYNPDPADRTKTPTSNYQLQFQRPDLLFNQFEVQDASGNATSQILEQGALRLNYDLLGRSDALRSVSLEAQIEGESTSIVLGSWSSLTQRNTLIDLSGFDESTQTNNPILRSGLYSLRAVATLTNGDRQFSRPTALRIAPWQQITGTLAPDVFTIDRSLDHAVILGLGGSDVLNLAGIRSSEVLFLNRANLDQYRPDRLTNQAIFGGTSFDVLQFNDGREIYFQGLERLNFADRSIALTMRPNDPSYVEQWNLRATDVENAWRFNSDSTSQVLLVSLDTGISPTTAPDLDRTRLRFEADTVTDNYNDDGHGQRAVSIMSAVINNGNGIAGINPWSPLYVWDLYGGSLGDQGRSTLQEALTETIRYARSNNLKVVFQGGIQGEDWLINGGTQAELEAILSGSEGDAFYAIAAGNGGIDLDRPSLTDRERETSGGVARLQGMHGNVASVGAVNRSDVKTVEGLENATTLERAGYSNFGRNLTLVAPTLVPSVNRSGDAGYFSGTSASNPNLAAIAALVWGVNLNLTGTEVRNILTETAMDLGTMGRDDYYGAGLVNADAAVRRAYALGRDRTLAQRWRIFI